MNKKFSLQLLLSVAVVTGTAMASELTTQEVSQTTTTIPSSDVSKVAPVAAAFSVSTTTQKFEVPADTKTVLIPEQKLEVTPAKTVKLTADTVVIDTTSASTPAKVETPAPVISTVVVPGPGDIALDSLEKISKSVRENVLAPAKEALVLVSNKLNQGINEALNESADLEKNNRLVEQTKQEASAGKTEGAKAAAEKTEEVKAKTWTEYGNAVVTHVKDYKWYYGTVGVAVLGYAGYKAYEAYQAKREADRERVLEALRSLSSN